MSCEFEFSPVIIRPITSQVCCIPMLYFQTAAGHRIAYSEAGPKEGPAVIFLHGGGQTRHAWTRSIRFVGDLGWHAIAIDMRGHGDSDWPGAYRVSQFAEDVLELAQAFTREHKPVLVGASLGGMSSLLANAGSAGEVSRALVLVDVAPRMKADGIERILGFMSAHPDGFANLEEAADAVAAYQPQRSQRSDNSGLRKNLRQKEDGRWYWHWDPTMLNTFVTRFEAQDPADEAPFHVAVKKLTQPLLLVRGKQSDVIDEGIIQEFRDNVPHAKVVDVSGAGHMVAGDKNDVFLDAVAMFLQKL